MLNTFAAFSFFILWKLLCNSIEEKLKNVVNHFFLSLNNRVSLLCHSVVPVFRLICFSASALVLYLALQLSQTWNQTLIRDRTGYFTHISKEKQREQLCTPAKKSEFFSLNRTAGWFSTTKIQNEHEYSTQNGASWCSNQQPCGVICKVDVWYQTCAKNLVSAEQHDWVVVRCRIWPSGHGVTVLPQGDTTICWQTTTTGVQRKQHLDSLL